MPHVSRSRLSSTSSIGKTALLTFPGTALLLGLLSFAMSSTVIAAETPAASVTKTFTAPDGSFSFTYPADLIHCERAKAEGDSRTWTPAENCVAPIPVCDGDVEPDQVSLACVAYPRDKITNTKAFGAATFSVEVIGQAATEKACLTSPAGAEPQPPTTIQGIRFAVFKFSDAGMNKSVDMRLHRAFHGGKCYQLGINVATTNAQVFDAPARVLTPSDLAEVTRQLDRARDSFRFLK